MGAGSSTTTTTVTVDGKNSVGDAFKNEEEKKGFFESNTYIGGKEFFTFCLAVVSLVMAVNSYQLLVVTTQSLNDVQDNWNTAPVLSVAIVTAGYSCPTGFTNEAAMSWPGSEQLGCGCPSNAAYPVGTPQSSSVSACNTNQTQASCVGGTTLAKVSLSSWRGTTFCYKRAPTTMTAFNSPRPAGSSPYSCPSGYQNCGGTNIEGGSVCVPSGNTCPVTYMGSTSKLSIESTSDTAFTSAIALAAQTGNGVTVVGDTSGFTVYKEAFADGAGSYMYMQTSTLVVPSILPAVDLATSFQQNGIQGPCLTSKDNNGGNEETSTFGENSYNATSSYTSSGITSFHHPGKCNQPDTRYLPFDYLSEKALLQENFYLSPLCSGAGSVTAALNTDYFTSGTKCIPGGAAPTGCEANVPLTAVTCGATDYICQDVYYNSMCGHLMRQLAAASTSLNIGMYYR